MGTTRSLERDTRGERERLPWEPQGHKESWELMEDGHVCLFYLDHKRLLHLESRLTKTSKKRVASPLLVYCNIELARFLSYSCYHF